MTFDQWFKREFSYVNANYEGNLQVIEDYMRAAWDHQQKEIDGLKKELQIANRLASEWMQRLEEVNPYPENPNNHNHYKKDV